MEKKEQKRKTKKVCSKSDIIRIMKRYSHYNQSVLDETNTNAFSYKNKKIIIKKSE